MSGGVKLGFRRRCAWCGVQLRGWQLNVCRLCRWPAKVAIWADPPCMHASRWDAEPDTWRRTKAKEAA